MSFGASETYIYAYIAFASVYVISSFVFVASALRVSTGLSRARQSAPSDDTAAASAVAGVVNHGQKVVDFAQLSTLLPLVYIVGSMFLGSVIAREVAMARAINIGWIAFTVLCAIASVFFAVVGIRESGAISHVPGIPESASGRAPEAVQRIGVRLGVSAALLLLVAVFTLLNLWSIISSLDALSAVDYLL
jgi:hypothetical protein